LQLLLFAVRPKQHSNRQSPSLRRANVKNHGKHRWLVKNDPSLPPADANAIQAVTPSDIYSWPGPDERLTQQSERTGIENKWFALTGLVVLKVETDGDIHIALQDATGDKPGIGATPGLRPACRRLKSRRRTAVFGSCSC